MHDDYRVFLGRPSPAICMLIILAYSLHGASPQNAAQGPPFCVRIMSGVWHSCSLVLCRGSGTPAVEYYVGGRVLLQWRCILCRRFCTPAVALHIWSGGGNLSSTSWRGRALLQYIMARSGHPCSTLWRGSGTPAGSTSWRGSGTPAAHYGGGRAPLQHIMAFPGAPAAHHGGGRTPLPWLSTLYGMGTAN